VTPDPSRRQVTRAAHVREHFRTSGRPAGHGYTRRNADEGTTYYAFDHGVVRCVVLDTVKPARWLAGLSGRDAARLAGGGAA